MGLSRNFVIFPKRPGVVLEGVPHCFLMFFDVLKVQEPPGNDSEWFSDRSFSHIFFHFCHFLSVECRFSESPLASPERLPQGNTCVSMAKMRILGRKSHQNDGFEPKFCHFSKTSRSGSGGCSTLFFNVFWCPEGPGTSWEWFWMIFGSIIFTSFFLIFVIFWVSNVGCQNTCSKAVLGCGTLV